MNKFSLLFIIIFYYSFSFAQEESDNVLNETSLFTLEVSYGPQFNGFVDYGKDIVIQDGNILPMGGFDGEQRLYQKREIGTYFNVTASLRLGGRNYLELGHSRTLNQGVYDGGRMLQSGVEVIVEDFQVRHRVHSFKLGYKRLLFKNKAALQVGIVDMHFQQSEVSISEGLIRISERNSENAYLSEAGAYLGFQYDLYSSGKFTLGARSTAYVILTAGVDLETLALAPYLRFNF